MLALRATAGRLREADHNRPLLLNASPISRSGRPFQGKSPGFVRTRQMVYFRYREVNAYKIMIQKSHPARPMVVIANWVHPQVVARLRQACDVIENTTREPFTPSELLGHCREANALIAFMTERIDEAFLVQCSRLRIIACVLKGYDNFDIEACSRRGVWLTVVPDLLTEPTAELILGLMIALGRHIITGDRFIRSGRFRGWRPTLYGQGLDGATVGLVGAGRIGQAVAQRLGGFRARLFYAEETSLSPEHEATLRMQRVTLDELLPQCDFVALCLPLNATTVHLVDRAFLARMKRGAFLINAARGSIVDETAVAAALKTQVLGGYAADVFAMEDWAVPGHPDSIPDGLLRADMQTVLTPHLGSAVDRVRHDIAMQAAMSVLECLSGQIPSHALNRPVATVR